MQSVSQAPINRSTQASLACCSHQRWAGRQHLKMKQDKKKISRNIQRAPAMSSSPAPANPTAWSCPRSVLYASAGAEMAIAGLASVAAQNQTNCLSLCKQEQDVMGFVQPLTDTCTFHSSYSLSLTSSAWFVSNRNIIPCHVRVLPCKY